MTQDVRLAAAGVLDNSQGKEPSLLYITAAPSSSESSDMKLSLSPLELLAEVASRAHRVLTSTGPPEASSRRAACLAAGAALGSSLKDSLAS